MADMGELVQTIVQRAMEAADAKGNQPQKLKSGVALARLLQTVPLRRQYKAADFHKTIQAWARGEGMPDADALLAAAKLTDISLDEYVRRESLQEQMAAWEARATKTQRELDDLRHEVEELRNRQAS